MEGLCRNDAGTMFLSGWESSANQTKNLSSQMYQVFRIASMIHVCRNPLWKHLVFLSSSGFCPLSHFCLTFKVVFQQTRSEFERILAFECKIVWKTIPVFYIWLKYLHFCLSMRTTVKSFLYDGMTRHHFLKCRLVWLVTLAHSWWIPEYIRCTWKGLGPNGTRVGGLLKIQWHPERRVLSFFLASVPFAGLREEARNWSQWHEGEINEPWEREKRKNKQNLLFILEKPIRVRIDLMWPDVGNINFGSNDQLAMNPSLQIVHTRTLEGACTSF